MLQAESADGPPAAVAQPVDGVSAGESCGQRIGRLIDEAVVMYSRYPADGLAPAHAAIALSTAAGRPRDEARARVALGRNLLSIGRFEDAVSAFRQADVLFESVGAMRDVAHCRYHVGLTLHQVGRYDCALELYDEALRTFIDLGDRAGQAHTIAKLGAVEARLGNFAAGLAYFDEALQLHGAAKSSLENLVSCQNARALAQVEQARMFARVHDAVNQHAVAGEAADLAAEALALIEGHFVPRLRAACLITFASALSLSGASVHAAAVIEEQIVLASRCGLMIHLAQGRLTQARGLLDCSQYDAAMQSARGALDIFGALGLQAELADAHETIAFIADRTGDYAAAYRHLRAEVDIKYRIQSEKSEQRARMVNLMYETDALVRQAEEMRKAATRDALTGLFNRRYADERLAELVKADAGRAVASIALADIDNFKTINDEFSHLVGDEVLRMVGAILARHCRATDAAVRYGGEEFLLVFPGLRLTDARKVCERIRKSLSNHDWTEIHPGLKVTMSVGLAATRGGESPEELVAVADRGLYQAKRAGRDRIEVALAD